MKKNWIKLALSVMIGSLILLSCSKTTETAEKAKTELKIQYSGGNSVDDNGCIKPCATKSTVDDPVPCDCSGYFCCRVTSGGEVSLQCRKPLPHVMGSRGVFGGIQLDLYEVTFDRFTAVSECNGILHTIALNEPNPLMPGEDELLFFEDNIPMAFPVYPWTITFSFYDAAGNLMGTKDWVAIN